MFSYVRSLICISLLCISKAFCDSDYQEDLLLRPLPEASLLASFTFRSNAALSSFNEQNFRLFPRSLGQILQHTHTEELHLRFSSGRWDEAIWGPRARDGLREGGTGVELWAWIDASSATIADERWLKLTNALSGLFCASLNFVDATRTIRPVMTFEPEGIYPNSSYSNLHLLHGTLPREVVCTENLTPFLKLLPCKGKAGIASLLDGHKVFDSAWQSMAIDVRPSYQGSSGDGLIEMEQSIDMVLDMERSRRPRDDPIPRPANIDSIHCDQSKYYHQYGDACYPQPNPGLPAFELSGVFGRAIKGSCPIGLENQKSIKNVCLDLSEPRAATVKSADAVSEIEVGASTECFPLSAGQDFDISLTEGPSNTGPHKEKPLLTAERTLMGRGQARGGLRTVFTNASPVHPITFVYLETLPWFMKPYLHTMKTNIVEFNAANNSQSKKNDPIKDFYYRPAVDRERSTHLELILTVPPTSTLTLSYDFDKTILRYTEYPPDANRGFDVAPAIIRILSPGPLSDSEQSHSGTAYLRTTSLLLYLPTPDFSMPYNVIILTSTVLALGFGSIFNILVRRFVSAEEARAVGGGIIKKRITTLVGKVKEKIRAAKKGKTE